MITMMETMITIIIRMTTMILLYDDNEEPMRGRVESLHRESES